MKKITILILWLFLFFKNSFSQQAIGIAFGYGTSRLFDFTKEEEYISKYNFHQSANVIVQYEMKLDSNTNFRFETSYLYTEMDLEVKNNLGKASFYRDLRFYSHFINLTLLYSFNLTPQKVRRFNFLIGPAFSINMQTRAEGSGWDYVLLQQVDTNGNNVSILTKQNLETQNKSSREFDNVNFGLDAGFELPIKITNSVTAFVQNRYLLNLSDILTSKKFNYTTFARLNFNVGLSFKL